MRIVVSGHEPEDRLSQTQAASRGHDTDCKSHPARFLPIRVPHVRCAINSQTREPFALLLAGHSWLIAPADKIKLQKWADRDVERLDRHCHVHRLPDRSTADQVLRIGQIRRSDADLRARTSRAPAE